MSDTTVNTANDVDGNKAVFADIACLRQHVTERLSKALGGYFDGRVYGAKVIEMPDWRVIEVRGEIRLHLNGHLHDDNPPPPSPYLIQLDLFPGDFFLIRSAAPKA
jgi:hypothetical protein